MAVNARHLVGRAVGVVNSTLNSTSSTSQLATENSSTSNATLNLISNLVFAESKSVRTSTIILAAFNVLAAFTTASSILYDCYWASKRCNPKFKASKFCVSSIHPAETFPLVLAIGIVIQGLVFAAVQGEGLGSLFTHGCNVIAQYMWPALFIVPYIQLVFGLECAFRSFRATPFQARGKYDVTICCATVVIMLIVTWIPSHIFPESRVCFASLVWFITRYGFLGFIILSTAAGLMILSAVTIFVRLNCVNLIDQHQRIAASRMVYYLVLGIVSLAFVIPYFASLIHNNGQDGDLKLAMMATVVLNLSGLMNGLLQLFLRSNTATTAFGPKIGRGWERTKHDIRIFGPNELAMHAQLMNPVTGPQSPAESDDWTHSRSSLVQKEEKGRIISMESLTGTPYGSSKAFEMELERMPSTPEPVVGKSSHGRKLSYSIFPSPKKETQPMSVYDISDLAPPPTIHFPAGSRHKRDSSVASSATVQIGLRLSHAPIPSQEDINNLPLPSTTYNASANSNTLALPATTFNAKSNTLALPTSTFNSSLTLSLPSTTYKAATPPTSAFSTTKPIAPLSPLRLQTSFSSDSPTPTPPPARSSNRQSPPPVNTSASRSPTQSPTRASPAVNKTLPPTPKFSFPAIEKIRDSNTQLSPAVYSPERKLPAPGLGALGGGPRSATLPQQLNNPLRGNPLDRTNSGRIVLPASVAPPPPPPPQQTQPPSTKDWI